METPSSLRRLARSRIGKKLESSALVDITNSPIVGLAAGSLKTPSSAADKTAAAAKTPSSGETILRCQVKSLLLQKVDEEEVSETATRSSFLELLSHLRSPRGFLAPTPANTPQLEKEEEPINVAGSLINRALLFESEEAEDDDDDDVEDLCDGMRRMFAGKHTRFRYNSEGEIVGEEEVGEVSPGVIVLRGLPAPVGKHLRFHDEEEED